MAIPFGNLLKPDNEGALPKGVPNGFTAGQVTGNSDVTRSAIKRVLSTAATRTRPVSSRISDLFLDYRRDETTPGVERVCEEIAVFELEFAFDDRVARPSSFPYPPSPPSLPLHRFRFFVFVRNEVSGVQVFSSLRAVIFASLLLSHVCIDGEC